LNGTRSVKKLGKSRENPAYTQTLHRSSEIGAASESTSYAADPVPPIAYAPKLIAVTFHPVRPISRYCMAPSPHGKKPSTTDYTDHPLIFLIPIHATRFNLINS